MSCAHDRGRSCLELNTKCALPDSSPESVVKSLHHRPGTRVQANQSSESSELKGVKTDFWRTPDRLSWNLVRLCIDLWRIWENCSFVARVLFAKNVFLGSKVCRTSDARNFGSKLVGIGALWPRFSPDRKMTRSGPLFILYDLQLFWLGRSSWFRCQSTGKCPAECRSHRYERMPGLPDPLWPVKLKNGYFWVFM